MAAGIRADGSDRSRPGDLHGDLHGAASQRVEQVEAAVGDRHGEDVIADVVEARCVGVGAVGGDLDGAVSRSRRQPVGQGVRLGIADAECSHQVTVQRRQIPIRIRRRQLVEQTAAH
jgi:C-terminal processing protease CtpA/Prc